MVGLVGGDDGDGDNGSNDDGLLLDILLFLPFSCI